MAFIERLASAIGEATGLEPTVTPSIDKKVYGAKKKGGKRRKVSAPDAYFSDAFRACLLAKSRPIASLPVHVYERTEDGRMHSTDGAALALEKLLRTRWHPFLSASEGMRWLIDTKDVLGNAYIRVAYDGRGYPSALYPITGGDVTPSLTGAGRPCYKVGVGDQWTPAGVYLPHEVVWVKSPIVDRDCLMGVSLAKLASRTLGLSIDLKEFYARLLENGDHFPGYLETDENLSPEDKREIADSLSDGGGIVSAGVIRLFDKGLHYKTSPLTMADISLIDQQQWILQECCRTLSVPPQEVYELSHATYSNIEQGAINFLNKTIAPECVEIEKAFDNVLDAMGKRGLYVQWDVNGLLRGDFKTRMEGYQVGVYAGFYTRQDVRAKEDMPRINGLERPLVPAAYYQLDPETGELIAPPKSPETAPQPDGQAALRAIHEDMERRIRERYGEGDPEKGRAFALKVLKPYAVACADARIPYDVESDINRIEEGLADA